MTLYIDKENISSFIRSKNNANFEDCEKLIRNNMNIHYNFSKDEIIKDDMLMLWFRSYGEGVVGKQYFCPQNEITPNRPLKSNFHKSCNKEQLSSVYLLNDERVCNLIAEKSCILIGKVGEEISIIKQLLMDSNETVTKGIIWEEYCPLLPLTDIIICDNHYFKNKTVYDKNSHAFLKELISTPKSSSVNVVIIIKDDQVSDEINLEAEIGNIRTLVKEITKSTKSSVTVLTTFKTHDRNAITNYYRIKNGSCFHIIDNQIKDDVTTEIKIHAIKANYNMSLNLLRVFQTIALSPVKCFGDKKSNYLKFE